MKTLKIFDLLRKRNLVTRKSARTIQPVFAAAVGQGNGEVGLDFAAVDGLTPSFFDETLSVVEECVQSCPGAHLRVVVTNPPTQLSSKFMAVGRGHRLTMKVAESGAWIIST